MVPALAGRRVQPVKPNLTVLLQIRPPNFAQLPPNPTQSLCPRLPASFPPLPSPPQGNPTGPGTSCVPPSCPDKLVLVEQRGSHTFTLLPRHRAAEKALPVLGNCPITANYGQYLTSTLTVNTPPTETAFSKSTILPLPIQPPCSSGPCPALSPVLLQLCFCTCLLLAVLSAFAFHFVICASQMY